VERLDLFGSVVMGTFDEQSSDVDFSARISDMSPGLANRYLDFTEALERLLGRPVDVMFDQPITNPDLRRSIEASREKVFERGTSISPGGCLTLIAPQSRSRRSPRI